MTYENLNHMTDSKNYIETYPQYINRLIILCIEHIVLLIIRICKKTSVDTTIYIKNKFTIKEILKLSTKKSNFIVTCNQLLLTELITVLDKVQNVFSLI